MPEQDSIVRLSAGLPSNDKILAAGGDAAWLYICGLAFSKKEGTGGVLNAAVVPRLSDRRQPRRLAAVLVRERLWHEAGHDCNRCPQPLPGRYVIHDYPGWQNGTGADTQTRAAKSAGGSFGNHQRWHTGRGHVDPDCQFCIASSSDDRSHMRSDTDPSSDRISESDANRISDAERSAPNGDPDSSPKDKPPLTPPVTTPNRSSDPATAKTGAAKRTRKQAYDYATDPDFLRFWAAFPQKSGKPAAYDAWLKAIARGADPDSVITAAESYAASLGRNPRKVKYPQGWLNDERYNDESTVSDDASDEYDWEA